MILHVARLQKPRDSVCGFGHFILPELRSLAILARGRRQGGMASAFSSPVASKALSRPPGQR